MVTDTGLGVPDGVRSSGRPGPTDAILGAMRFFNCAGPVEADRHYRIPPLERVDLEDILTLIGDEHYFVLHAPRQTGKTTVLRVLRDLLNSGSQGNYRCASPTRSMPRSCPAN